MVPLGPRWLSVKLESVGPAAGLTEVLAELAKNAKSRLSLHLVFPGNR
jgi:hypothetical protein